MDRIIDVKVNGDYLSMDRRKAGNQHEANITRLRIHFDPNWDGLAKTVTFWDANGNHPVKRTLTADRLEDAAKDIRVYLCPIPGEALAESGMMTFTIDGYRDGVRQRTAGAELEVEESPYEESAGEPADPTPSQAEQLQVQIDTILQDMQEQADRAVVAATAAEQAKNAAESARDASLEIVGGDYVTREELDGKAEVDHTHTAAGIGALATGVVSNIDTIESDGIFATAGDATGTFPGDVGLAIGVVIHKEWDVNYKEQVFLGYATHSVYHRVMRSAVWGEWVRLITTRDADDLVYALAGKVPLDGSAAMTGALHVAIGGGNASLVADPACAYLQAFQSGTWDQRRTLLLRTKESAPGLDNILTVATAGDETAGEYTVIHTGNLHLVQQAATQTPKITVGSYRGTGTNGADGASVLTFEFEPKFLAIQRGDSYGRFAWAFWVSGAKSFASQADSYANNVTSTGNEVRWYSADNAVGQLNENGALYLYIAIG